MKNLKITLSVLLSLVLLQLNAQEEGILDQIREEEHSNIEAIALYPEKERRAILTASMYPEILVRLQNMQARTSTNYQKLIGNLSEADQRKVYDLSRYPGLLNEICALGKKKSTREMEDILKNYPEEIHEEAIYMNKKHFDLLFEVNVMYKSADEAFEETLSAYPDDVQDAYRELVKLPEIMSILTDNLNLTVLLGDMYKENPDKITAELDSLNVVVAEQKARELEEWKQSLEDNPQAMQEYEMASKEFAREQGYDEMDYSGTIPDRHRTDVYIHHVWQPYPYWFGCPWYYTYDCWYPYPWWYHWGYYYGPGNVVVFVGMPSSYFLYWHYYDYYHLYHYPHFTNHVIHYHEHHAQSVTPITTVTENWIKDKEPELPKNWFKEDGKRVERIKEYGKFKMDYQMALDDGSINVPTQREYLEQNVKDYPSLKPVLKEQKDMGRTDYQIRKEPVQRELPATRPVEPKYQPREKVIERPRTAPQVIDRAKKHHENTWQRPRPQIQQRRPVVRPPVRQTPIRRPPVQRPPVQRPPVRKIPPGKN